MSNRISDGTTSTGKTNSQIAFCVKIQNHCSRMISDSTLAAGHGVRARLQSIYCRSERKSGRGIYCSGVPLLLCDERFVRKKIAPSNWPIGEQTDNRAALDGRQSAMLSAPLFNGSIVSPLSRPKYAGALFITRRASR